MKSSAIVIGAGITGLVTAWRLARSGRSVLLVESGEIGGLIQTKHVQGFTLECGPNVLVKKPALLELLMELDLESAIVNPSVPDYQQMVWLEDRPVAVPKSARAVLMGPFFSPSAALATFARTIWPRVLRPRAVDESVETFFSRVIGNRAVTSLLDPALKGVFGGSADTLSARSIFPELWHSASAGKSLLSALRTRKRPGIFTLKGGLSILSQRLLGACGDQLRLVHDTAKHVQKTPRGFNVMLGKQTVSAEELYLTCSGAATAALVRSLDRQVSTELDSLQYAGLVVLHCSVDCTQLDRLPKDAFGVLFPDNPARLLGVMFNSVVFHQLAPANKVLLTVCLGGTGAEDLFALADAALTNTAVEELRTRFNLSDVQVLSVTRWPRAIPQYIVGHYRLDERLSALEQKFRGLFVLGTERGGVGIADRVKTVAQRVMA